MCDCGISLTYSIAFLSDLIFEASTLMSKFPRFSFVYFKLGSNLERLDSNAYCFVEILHDSWVSTIITI